MSGLLEAAKEIYKENPEERYVVGQDFNTKDWFVYDNVRDENVCWAKTEEEANLYVKNGNTLGLTRERYEQLLALYGDAEEVAEKVSEWGADVCNKGYSVFEFNNRGIFEIERIDELGVFEDDRAASEQALKDGVKLIPIEELPVEFPHKYLGWIDTPENREAIKGYSK